MHIAMDLHSNRKLNFNLPLLSTRRHGGLTGEENSCRNTNDRIPFSWEEAPGKPKGKDGHDFQDEDTPRPRLPPCRWRQEKASAAAAAAAKTKTNTDNDANHDARINGDNDHHDDGCDADVEDYGNEEEEEYDVFSDAADVMSLTEAIDIAQKAEDDHHHHPLDMLNLESADFSDHSQSPNFMIERFLPDATALAAATSVLYASNNPSKKLPYSFELPQEYGSRGRRSYSDCSSQQKGCGLEYLFPWRIKHKLCGVKNPVIRQVSPNKNVLQCTAKQKKDCCSSNKHFRDASRDI